MLLRAENLTKDYGRLRALDHFNLTVSAGEVFGLLGPNGSGKSTALRIFLGFLKPTEGTAAIDGCDCWRDGVNARRRVAYLPGELRLYENMTGWQLIRFLGRLRGQKDTGEIERLAKRFDIDLSRPISQMSSGMKRKVALLQVLVAHARLLIMDEPTNTLDPSMREELLLQIHQARDQGQAVLFSSHVLQEVEQVCDRVGILQKGRLAQVQTMSELQEGRLIRVKLEKPFAEVPALPGLRLVERHDSRLSLEATGPLPPVLEWLARQPVTDLRIEPLGLASVYRRYHGEVA